MRRRHCPIWGPPAPVGHCLYLRAQDPDVKVVRIETSKVAALRRYLKRDAKVVQERLGHSGISVTMYTYSHVLPGMQEQAASSLADRLMGRDTGICKPFADGENQE